MNKSILLQSIKSVSGFLAVCSIIVMTIIFGLKNYPTATIPVLIIALFSWMVWMEYKTRADRFK